MKNLLIFLMVLCTWSGRAQTTLHVFLVAETNDYNIGARADLPRMQQKMHEIAEMVGYELRLHVYEKHKIQPNQFITKIKNFECNPNDVIWFYYSGHGFQAYDYGSGQFTGFKVDTTRFTLEAVHAQLQKAHPRLLITMYDACNWRNFDYTEEVVLQPSQKSAYKALFHQVRGSIKVASNTAGYHQFSWGDPQTGGFFTSAFLESLESLTAHSSNPTWQALLSQTQARTTQIANHYQKHQIPYYEINIH
jgi:Caspase domain